MMGIINKLKNWQIALLMSAIGLVSFISGLGSPFMGDDFTQIVNNPPVHHIGNLFTFFNEGTFSANGSSHLVGSYYRPLMTTTYSLIYSLFGAHPIYYHLVQFGLCIASAFILFLFFKLSFSKCLSLFLALAFLLLPINSQVAYAIPSMQDALFFFFGILSLWLLARFRSNRSLIGVSICLLLSLFSKETGIVFVVLGLLYLFLWNKKRLKTFVLLVVPVLILWLVLRIHVLGLIGHNPMNAPIDRLGLADRLITAPSIMLFYLSKFIFPWRLATAYYWVHTSFSWRYFILPLLIDLGFISTVVIAGIQLHKVASKEKLYTYIFFICWFGIGLLTCLQIIPLDMTACEIWFYASSAGLLGAIGVIYEVFRPNKIKYNSHLAIGIYILILIVFGVRTILRGTDYKSQYSLSKSDIVASPTDYTAYSNLSQYYINKAQYGLAVADAYRSVNIFPYYFNYTNLGTALGYEGKFTEASEAYTNALRYNAFKQQIEDYNAELTLISGKPEQNIQILGKYIKDYPRDSTLWTCIAVWEFKYGSFENAKLADIKAASFGRVSPGIYNSIMQGKSFIVTLDNHNTVETKNTKG